MEGAATDSTATTSARHVTSAALRRAQTLSGAAAALLIAVRPPPSLRRGLGGWLGRIIGLVSVELMELDRCLRGCGDARERAGRIVPAEFAPGRIYMSARANVQTHMRASVTPHAVRTVCSSYVLNCS